MKVAAIICARMGSKRFPGKVMEKIAGVPMLEHICDRAKKLYGLHDVIIATTTRAEDDRLKDCNYPVFRGPVENVISRITKAVYYDYDFIYRMTGDNPVVDPDVYMAAFNPHADYTTIAGMPDGTQPEFISVEALQRLRNRIGDDPYFQEHPTQGFYKYILGFNMELRHYKSFEHHRLTVDYPEDLEMFNRMYADISLDSTLPEIIQYLDANPRVARINAHLKSEHRIGDLSQIPPDREG